VDSALLAMLRADLVKALTAMAVGQSANVDPFTSMLDKVMAQDEAGLAGEADG
jgi:hypothetical protein